MTTHANPYRAWLEMGSPEYPTRQQLERLDRASRLAEKPLALRTGPSTGETAFTLTLPGESVAAVRIAR